MKRSGNFLRQQVSKKANLGAPVMSAAPTPSFLEPLANASKIKISGKNSSDPRSNALYKKFDDFKNDLLNKSKPKEGLKRLELANFIVNQLAQPRSTTREGELDYLNLLQKSKIDPTTKAAMDLYDPNYGPKKNQQVISLSPNNLERNPITTLMHEGVHALDDAQMRTYQKEAIDYLANEELQGNLSDPQLKSLLEGAQGILNNRTSGGRTTFQDSYSYNEFFKPNITKSFNALQDQRGPAITNFREAQSELNKIRTDGDDPGDAFLVPFSEFPAFAMEKLFYPWNINAQTNPQSKRFLENIMTGVRRNFKEMGLQNPGYKQFKYTNPNDPTTYKNSRTQAYTDMQANNPGQLMQQRSNYPNVYQAFKDRKAQFKNPLVSQMTGQNPNTTSALGDRNPQPQETYLNPQMASTNALFPNLKRLRIIYPTLGTVPNTLPSTTMTTSNASTSAPPTSYFGNPMQPQQYLQNPAQGFGSMQQNNPQGVSVSGYPIPYVPTFATSNPGVQQNPGTYYGQRSPTKGP